MYRHVHIHTHGAHLPAVGWLVEVFLGVWVWHPRWVTPHNVEVGSCSHSGLGMPLDLSWALGGEEGGEEGRRGGRGRGEGEEGEGEGRRGKGGAREGVREVGVDIDGVCSHYENNCLFQMSTFVCTVRMYI